MVSFFATFYILPILIKVFSVSLDHQNKERPQNSFNNIGGQIFEFVANYRRTFVTLFFLLIALSCFFVQKISFKENFLKQLREGHPFSKSALFFQNAFEGMCVREN